MTTHDGFAIRGTAPLHLLAPALLIAAMAACDDTTGLDAGEVRIEGTVRALYDDVPVPGAEVTLDVVGHGGARAWAAAVADSTGAYTAQVTVPGGCDGDSVEVVIQGEAPDHARLVLGGPGSPMQLACGESSVMDLELYRNVFRTPQPVAGVGTATQLSVNRGHSCAITTAGAYCWGSSGSKLGNPNATGKYVTTPVPVVGGESFTYISAGEWHTCALDQEGAAWCWGYNDSGQVGVDRSVLLRVPEPRRLETDLRFVQIQAGRMQSCARTADGEVYCWGWGPLLGMDVMEGDYATPQRVQLEGRYVDVSAEFSASSAVEEGGGAYSWGFSYEGELGSGETTGWAFTPVSVLGDQDWADIDTGCLFSCGLTTAGDAYCWGRGFSGQLGYGGTESSFGPIAVAGGHTFAGISAGTYHTCAATAAGEAYCWGDNEHGGPGIPADEDEACLYGPCVPTPAAVPTDLRFTTVQAGGWGTEYTCGITTGQQLYCWGDRRYLGSGRTLGAAMASDAVSEEVVP